MPLHDVGYRRWNQPKTSIWSRWFTITESGIRLALQSRWVRRLLFFAWLPVLLWGSFFFSIESLLLQYGDSPNTRTEFRELALDLEDVENLSPDEIQQRVEEQLRNMGRRAASRGVVDELDDDFGWLLPDAGRLNEALKSGDEGAIRNVVWSSLLLTFFRIPQGLMILFLVGIIGPGLIARDIRSRAFLLYFSKPINVLEYVAGKFFILVFFIVMVTTLPAIALYLLGVMLSPDLSVVWSTWHIPLQILLATLFLVIPTVSLVLMLSAMTQETRFAGFAWFAIWALGQGAYLAVVVSQAIHMNQAPVEPEVLQSSVVQQWSVLSLYNNLGAVQNWVFGFSSLSDALPALIALGAITLFSLFLLFRRVRANIRA